MIPLIYFWIFMVFMLGLAVCFEDKPKTLRWIIPVWGISAGTFLALLSLAYYGTESPENLRRTSYVIAICSFALFPWVVWLPYRILKNLRQAIRCYSVIAGIFFAYIAQKTPHMTYLWEKNMPMSVLMVVLSFLFGYGIVWLLYRLWWWLLGDLP